MHWPQFFVGLLIVSVASPCFAQPARSKRLPVPEQTEQVKSKELLRAIYKDDFAKATKTEQKLTLAGKFLADAIATKDAPVDRYVLLKITSDLAASIGSADVATRALDEIVRDYEVDGDLLRLEVVEKLAASATDAELVKTCDVSLTLSEKLSAADRYAEAARAAAAELQAAKRTKNVPLVKAATARHEAAVQLAKEYADTQGAAATLETSPTDANANLLMGKFYCFAKQDWERGLPMLALGSDKELAKLGAAEIVAESPADRVACADQWLDLSQKSQGTTRTAQRRRAYDVYLANVSSVAGLTAKKVESRLADLEPEFAGSVKPPKVDILHVFRGHSGGTFSPDSRTVVTCDNQGTLHLWNLQTLREICQFKGHGGVAATAITFTSDGKKIVTAGRDKNAHVWDVNTGAELQSFELKSDDGMNFIQLSTDGRRGLFVRRHRVWSYEIDKGRLVKEYDVSGGHGETWFRSMSSDGRLVASSGFANTVRIFDLVRGSQVNFEAPQHSYGAALSPDGKLVLDAGGDPTVRMRNVANLKQVLTEYKGAGGHIYGVNFSADGKLVLACGGAKKAHVWDTRSGKLLHTYELGAGTNDIRSSPNGLYAAAAANDAVHLLGLPK